MVGLSGLEPPTSRLSGERSNQLSYRPRDRFARGMASHLRVYEDSQLRCWREGRRVTLVLEANAYAHSGRARRPSQV